MLSARFHLRFFPALLKGRFGGNAAAPKTSFVAAGFLKGVQVLFIAIAAASAGVSLHPGIAGWLMLFLAAACVVYTLVISVREARGTVPTYENFLFPLFFMCLALGLAAGAIAGLREPALVRIIYGCGGMALGYGAGLLTGLHGQRLGFFAVLLYPFALASAAGMMLTVILLLST